MSRTAVLSDEAVAGLAQPRLRGQDTATVRFVDAVRASMSIPSSFRPVTFKTPTRR